MLLDSCFPPVLDLVARVLYVVSPRRVVAYLQEERLRLLARTAVGVDDAAFVEVGLVGLGLRRTALVDVLSGADHALSTRHRPPPRRPQPARRDGREPLR